MDPMDEDTPAPPAAHQAPNTSTANPAPPPVALFSSNPGSSAQPPATSSPNLPNPQVAAPDDGTASTATARSFEGLIWDLKAESSSDGASDSASFATSMTDSATQFKFEHGRRYHAYESRESRHPFLPAGFHAAHDVVSDYALPNDDKEIQRLELQHMIWTAVFNQRLALAPISTDITTAVDFGCGTGAWAIEFANAYPECRIIGTDLSPIQPEYIPSNCGFLIDDANHPWPSDWAGKFDYVHTRAIGMGVSDWDLFVSQSYTALKPGAWLELQEFHIPFGCDDGTVRPGSALDRWAQNFMLGASKIGVDPQAGLRHANRMRNRGFRRVREMKLKIPIGPWCKGKREKNIGHMALQDLYENIEGLSMKIFAIAGLSHDEIVKLCDEVKEEWMSPRAHSIYIVAELSDISWAQKPPLNNTPHKTMPATSSESMRSATQSTTDNSETPSMSSAGVGSNNTPLTQTDDTMSDAP
ncbi:S-adenosyl-L-methionine-dependent methyltransferase [Zalerion maritima]|uniref:S-adenosyl-L-methionine-dependent methyltransferase n=1 Tax=Zalerion maritima TaxID=339359 RepID=A0AAD5WS58_9PEZI|nr:S-adenosyl-L-methionine-dependent methyltransferase [Zalerion maritima]